MTEQAKGVRWDLTGFFPEFNGPEMQKFNEELIKDIVDLQQNASSLGKLSGRTLGAWEKVILGAENTAMRLSHIGAYLGCLTSTYADREDYAQEEASIARIWAEWQKLEADILEAFKTVSNDVFEKFIKRRKLSDAAYSLKRRRQRALKTMSCEKEKLAADLNVDGYHAWDRLYDRITGKLEFDMIYPDGRTERTPISQWRSMMANPDRQIGRSAFECGNRIWQRIEDVCAAALNAIAGTRLTLYRHRGINHFLEQALIHAGIKRETLDAMYRAIFDNIEIPRAILRSKASFMGRDKIWWFEREAPLPLENQGNLSWDEVADTVVNSFGRVYPALSEYCKSALQKRWVESEARPGKRPGAFCSGSVLLKEQRVFMTHTGALGNITTLAHELGHAFHGHNMRDVRPLSREVPMTLAETASVFGELCFIEGMNSDIFSDKQKLLVLDSDLTSAAVMLLDITVRFEFEKTFYEERQKGEVSVSRLKDIMVETQKKVFGEAMFDDGQDPYFWASKMHFYISGVSFYNFPYTFGFLLARALYARMKNQGEDFFPMYEKLLKLSGSDTVENIVRDSIGGDTTKSDFWKESITSLQPLLDRYRILIQDKR